MPGRQVTPLKQGNGATAWAGPADQSARPCFVPAPQYQQAIVNDRSEATNMLDTTVHLVEQLVSQYGIDLGQLYATGQSGGCMISNAMNIESGPVRCVVSRGGPVGPGPGHAARETEALNSGIRRRPESLSGPERRCGNAGSGRRENQPCGLGRHVGCRRVCRSIPQDRCGAKPHQLYRPAQGHGRSRR